MGNYVLRFAWWFDDTSGATPLELILFCNVLFVNQYSKVCAVRSLTYELEGRGVLVLDTMCT